MTPSNRHSVFASWTATVLLLSGAGRCGADLLMTGDSQSGPDFQTSTGGKPAGANDISGNWYAVMSTACTDDGPCNILTNNNAPCVCLSAFFIPLQDKGWQVFMNAIHEETQLLTIDMGGASATSPDNTNIKGFILNRAVIPTSVIAVSQNYISEKVSGSEHFIKYEMSIIGSGADFFYMVTTMKIESGSEFTVIWSRNRRPGKHTTWTQILRTLYELNINPHDLSFISQEGCHYPSMEQYNEIFFCIDQIAIN